MATALSVRPARRAPRGTDARPVVGRGLPEQAHRRIPGRVGAPQHPEPVRYERQQRPDAPADGAPAKCAITVSTVMTRSTSVSASAVASKETAAASASRINPYQPAGYRLIVPALRARFLASRLRTELRRHRCGRVPWLPRGLLRHPRGERLADLAEDARPVVGRRLPEQAHRRIPGRIGAPEHPAAVRNERQQRPRQGGRRRRPDAPSPCGP